MSDPITKTISLIDQAHSHLFEGDWTTAQQRLTEAKKLLEEQGRTMGCAYCGLLSQRTGDRDADLNTMVDHIMACDKNPVRRVANENAQLRETLLTVIYAVADFAKHVDDILELIAKSCQADIPCADRVNITELREELATWRAPSCHRCGLPVKALGQDCGQGGKCMPTTIEPCTHGRERPDLPCPACPPWAPLAKGFTMGPKS